MEAPPPPDEAQRLKALSEYEPLDPAAALELDDVARLAAHVCSAPIAVVSFVSADQLHLVGRSGIDAVDLPRCGAFCAHTILGDVPLIVADAAADRRFCDGPLVAGPIGVRFYAGVPLVTPAGHALGALCVMDTRPRDLTPVALGHLTVLARQVVRHLEQRRSLVSLGATVAQLTQANADLEAARRSAVAATEAKSTFLANMSHEIRTPMAAILGLTDLMLAPAGAGSDPAACLQTIRRQGDHLMSILNDILDLSKIEAGRMTVGPIACNLHQIVHDVAALIGPRAVEKGLAFNVDAAPDLPTVVQTDPTRLRQILLNLLSNAVKFTATGSVSLRVGATALAGGEHRIEFDVIDTGIGLSAEQQQQLFHPFVQADTSPARKSGGTGLGLVISKRLAQALGGDVTLTSRAGHGSTFTATIVTGAATSTTAPAATETAHFVVEAPPAPPPVASATAAKVDTKAANQKPTSSRQGTRGRVLLAEDDETLQMLTAVHLRRAGFEVVLADNGKQACDYVAAIAAGTSAPFDLILMDMQMPVLDGFSAVAQLRRGGYAGPIVALTADAMAHQRVSIVASGCDECLTKPLNGPVFHRLLDRLVPPKVARVA